ncbi:uncharacterized protein B0H18DRAFT_976475 [Fomitopsis serialis]|uniref:uncharacterized protein n=1 Tax=Fomitopsis serialis TaxID=139415 RepID=UPI002007D2D4|nr:uncharacterized protein B0H18DRAFT_976475 [Neoantrodia serialis]KAH9935603.1 hypothetical protein B0H18DRAFT_976475 [Neoantrodia serialis]
MSTGWNFTIDDSSAFITYKPFEDGGLGNRTLIGWEPSWSGSGGFPTAYANSASGQSLHITALDGASLNFQFYGDAVYLHGSTNGTFDVTIDNDAYTNQSAVGNGLLYFADDLATQTHYVTLTAHFSGAGQVLEFDLANVTYTFADGSDGKPLEVVYANTNTSAFQYTGGWSVKSDADVPSPTSTAPFHITSQYGSSVSLNFTGEAIAMYGLRNWGNWIYNVTLDGYQTQYNGSTPWKQGNSLLFFEAGLDPNRTHTIVLTDEADQTYWQMILNSVSVFQANHTQGGTASSSATSVSNIRKSTNAGAIAGGVVGGVVGLLLIIGLILWLFRRHASRQYDASRKSDISPFPVLPTAATPSSHSLKDGAVPTTDSSYTAPVTPVMYHKGASVGGPPTAQIPVSAPVTVVSTSPPSSSIGPPTVATSETGAPPLPETGLVAGVASTPGPSAAHPPAVSVDHIIELIAQRIDRRSSRGPYEGDAPPRYPESVYSD